MTPDAGQIAAGILCRLPFTPNPQQSELILSLSDFASSYGDREVFMLNGYAGTGKTSIIGALVKTLAVMKLKTVTLAPTGRAAKVAGRYSQGKTSTIHRRIFHQISDTPGEGFALSPNRSTETIFIVDEASMIADRPGQTDSLLALLVRYVYSGRRCSMIMLGDIAQLPPVGCDCAPAMRPERLRQLGLQPRTFTLDITERQGADSGILHNATYIRRLLMSPLPGMSPKLFAEGFEDIRVISQQELADELSDSWGKVGIDDTVIITRSNKRANDYNMAIRNLVMMAEEPLQQGDRLIVAKNDYYWSAQNHLPNLIANGDQVVVDWVGRREKAYGRWYVDVELTLPAEQRRVAAKVMLRSLMTDGPSIPQAEMQQLHSAVAAAQEGTPTEQYMAALVDPYYNSLQVKYGYCVTCHKAQGGQWAHVYIDMGGIAPDMIDTTFYRWLYTAITRATSRLYFIAPTIPIT